MPRLEPKARVMSRTGPDLSHCVASGEWLSFSVPGLSPRRWEPQAWWRPKSFPPALGVHHGSGVTRTPAALAPQACRTGSAEAPPVPTPQGPMGGGSLASTLDWLPGLLTWASAITAPLGEGPRVAREQGQCLPHSGPQFPPPRAPSLGATAESECSPSRPVSGPGGHPRAGPGQGGA